MNSNTSDPVPFKECGSPQDHPAVFYFPGEPEKGGVDFLLFEEQSIHNPGWNPESKQSRKLWQRMKDRYEQVSCEAFAGDKFVRRLHSFRKITVLLNHPIETSIVKERFRKMVRDRSYHHLRWMIVDLAFLPFSVVLWIIPGPNVVGYYLLFRVISHWLSFRSASRVEIQNLDVQVSTRAEEVHSLIRKARDIRAGLQELRKRYGLRALQEHQFIPQSAVIREALSKIRFVKW